VLTTDVCGYAHYIEDADAGRVLASPFDQARLDSLLAYMLVNERGRVAWGSNGLAFAETADIYSLHERAADIILANTP
jgi:UDP-glucose:(heptosyl)LPS alpha-1,3-glucosyltransferase